MTKSKYEDEDWDDLPEEAQEAAKVLGYDKRMWNKDEEPELVDESDWEDLTKEQQEAAKVLGYNEDNWDDEGGFCCCSVM